jgi:radical SAM-linked protein
MTQATKVRLRFAKRGDLRLVSHHDLLRCLERLLRRAQINVALTQGYCPRPKITFALALGLGIESLCEVVDLELASPLEPTELLERLRAESPPGFDWTDACPLLADARPPRPRAVEYSFYVHEDRRAACLGTLQSLLESQSWPLTRKRPERESVFDLRPHVLRADLTADGLLRFCLKVAPDGSARPEELLEALALRDLLDRGTVLTRTGLELSDEEHDRSIRLVAPNGIPRPL